MGATNDWNKRNYFLQFLIWKLNFKVFFPPKTRRNLLLVQCLLLINLAFFNVAFLANTFHLYF